MGNRAFSKENLRHSVLKLALTVKTVDILNVGGESKSQGLRSLVTEIGHSTCLLMNYLLLGSLRFDRNLRDAEWNSAANGGDPSPYLLLPYVADRFISAIKAHNWPELQLHQLHNLCEKAVQGIDVPRKVGMSYSSLDCPNIDS